MSKQVYYNVTQFKLTINSFSENHAMISDYHVAIKFSSERAATGRKIYHYFTIQLLTSLQFWMQAVKRIVQKLTQIYGVTKTLPNENCNC